MEREPGQSKIYIDQTSDGQSFGWRIINGEPKPVSQAELDVELARLYETPEHDIDEDNSSTEQDTLSGRERSRKKYKSMGSAVLAASFILGPWIGIAKFGTEKWANDPVYELPADAWEDINSIPGDVVDLPKNLADIAGWPFTMLVDKDVQEQWDETKGES